MRKTNDIFEKRLAKHMDELRWLYMELYDNEAMFAELCEQMQNYYHARNAKLRKRDLEKEKDQAWYRKKNMLGMMLYIDNFAGNLRGVKGKLKYLEECGVNCVHLMPFLDSPKGRSDGGYAVADFRKVKPELGTIEDLADLAEACHEKDMNLCMDFVMNHTSEDHEWAQKARMGEGEYMSRYFFCDNENYVREYEKTVPQVFPETAPGNFTWLPEIGHYVLTTFYPYQWDLNYKNPRVFNEMMYNFLFLVNQGIDILRIDAVPYIWKEMGTSCRNLPQVHTIVRMMRMIGEIVCPSVVLLGEVVMEPEKVEACVDEVGIGFMFAQTFNKSMRFVGQARSEMGIRTVFNILGPLANPSGAKGMVVGVYDPALTEIIASVMGQLDVKRALVVSGRDHMDEITLSTKTVVSELKDGTVETYEIAPEDFGFKTVDLAELQGGTAAENAEITRAILSGEERRAKREIVLLNAGAALYIGGKAESIADGIILAKEAIDSGKAAEVLENLVNYTK
mgnify:FL=1